MLHQRVDASADGRLTSPPAPRTVRDEMLADTWIYAIRFWIERQRQRKSFGELAGMNNHLLRDIDVSQEAALREAAKPFWR